MVSKDKKSRWDYLGEEPEPQKEQKPEKQPEIVTTPSRPEDYTKDQLWQIYNSLPDDLKHVVFSEETANTNGELGQKYGLSDDEIHEFAKLEGFVLLGILPPNQFKDKLKQVLHLSHDTIDDLFQEVDDLIFNPVRESLNKLYAKAEEGKEVEKKINSDVTTRIDQGVKKPLTEGYGSYIRKVALYVVKWFQAGFLRLYCVFTFLWCFIIGLTMFGLAGRSDSRSTIADILGGSLGLAIGGTLYMLILLTGPIMRLDEKWARAIAEDRLPWWIGLIRLFFIVLPYYFYGWVPRKVCEWYFYNYMRR